MAPRGKKKRSSRNGGFKGALSSLIVITLLISGILAWGKINNINSPSAAMDYFRDWSDYITECGGQEAQWNCDSIFKLPDSNNGGDSKDNPSIGNGSSEDSSKAVKRLASIKVADAQKVDYNRSDWRHWSGSPCNAREEALIRQGSNVKKDKSCKITAGTWIDPYGGEKFTNASKLDIDHVIPLAYAARHGGNNWSADRKEQFANDASQLLAVSASENRKKSDKGPADYMPPQKDFHCDYSTIWVNTAAKYDLTITAKDKTALEKGLKRC